MENAVAKIHISLAEGVVEFEGSEEFVSAQLDRFEELIKAALEGGNKGQPKASANGSKAAAGGTASGGEAGGLANYENLFAEADGKIQILKSLPGAGKAQKTVSAALLLAFANSLKGIDHVTAEAVRALCSAHACLDSSNFASSIKAEKEYFLVTGAKSKSIALTVPGKKKAEELAKSLNSQ